MQRLTFVLEPHNPEQNHLLAALLPVERERIYPHLQLVPMPLGKVLYESGDVQRHVYFPIDSIVSLLYVMADGASAEISVVGNEGIVGVSLFMGGETTPSRAIVQSAGHAYQLIGQRLKDEFHRTGGMQLVLLRYTHNPNGSVDDIAGIANERGNVVGLMPHPERASSALLGSTDGLVLFGALLASVRATV